MYLFYEKGTNKMTSFIKTEVFVKDKKGINKMNDFINPLYPGHVLPKFRF